MKPGSAATASLVLLLLATMNVPKAYAFERSELEQTATYWRLRVDTRFTLTEGPEPGLVQRTQGRQLSMWPRAEQNVFSPLTSGPSNPIQDSYPQPAVRSTGNELFEPVLLEPVLLEPVPGMYRRIGSDIVDLVRQPASMDRRDWIKFGAVVAAIGTVSLVDDDIRATLRFNTEDSQKFARSIRPLGQEASLVFLGASWLAGTQWDRPVLRAIAVDGLEASIVASGLISPILKGTFGRSRPYLGLGSGNFGGSESFPSGESTQAFAVASVVAAHSQSKWVDVIAYSLAGLTAWQRIELDAHWASDVVAGAAIGTAVGRWVVKRNHGNSTPRWTLSPTVGQGGGGLLVRLNLGGNRATKSAWTNPWAGR